MVLYYIYRIVRHDWRDAICIRIDSLSLASAYDRTI